MSYHIIICISINPCATQACLYLLVVHIIYRAGYHYSEAMNVSTHVTCSGHYVTAGFDRYVAPLPY